MKLKSMLSIAFILIVFSSQPGITQTVEDTPHGVAPDIHFGNSGQIESDLADRVSLMSACCLMMMPFLKFDDRKNFVPVLNSAPKIIETKNIGACDSFREDAGGETVFARRYLYAVIVRTCRSIMDKSDSSIFASDKVGGAPYAEIVPDGKYRFRFFTDLSSFPITRVPEMGEAKHTFLDITITLNASFSILSDKNGSSTPSVVTLDCDGQWRNFFQQPTDFDLLFSQGSMPFTLRQQDSCEDIVLNAVSRDPAIGRKIN
ncbi:hypothetical protein M2324_004033 [Rhodovulum sulfidophilum]|uniref:hypothetical protein n=1 Tax=Rhodovulum sulfidophilum TaxID=35806 RepID=UPI000AED3138|nr:hypothetical protein [Rhodovulum sulfidophilum]MCW2305606.1 hypothetical protein [Rhodovulum sulfidophilum]